MIDHNETVGILGQNYSIQDTKDDPKMKDSPGYMEPYTKEIFLNANIIDNQDYDTVALANNYMRKVLRHEIVHAFIMESGLNENEEFQNKKVVGWIAHQAPKMIIAFLEAGAIEPSIMQKINSISK